MFYSIIYSIVGVCLNRSPYISIKVVFSLSISPQIISPQICGCLQRVSSTLQIVSRLQSLWRVLETIWIVLELYRLSGECQSLSGECWRMSGECQRLYCECQILSGECTPWTFQKANFKKMPGFCWGVQQSAAPTQWVASILPHLSGSTGGGCEPPSIF